jgi:hypothetical protein
MRVDSKSKSGISARKELVQQMTANPRIFQGHSSHVGQLMNCCNKSMHSKPRMNRHEREGGELLVVCDGLMGSRKKLPLLPWRWFPTTMPHPARSYLTRKSTSQPISDDFGLAVPPRRPNASV